MVATSAPQQYRVDPRRWQTSSKCRLLTSLDERNWRRDNFMRDGKRREYWAVPWRERYIWGATAACCAPSAKCCCTGHRMTEAERHNGATDPVRTVRRRRRRPRAGRCLLRPHGSRRGVSGYSQLHPHTLDSSRDKLYWFLSGWLGGPSLYIERFGHPRLRARHLPFPIGEAERDARFRLHARRGCATARLTQRCRNG